MRSLRNINNIFPDRCKIILVGVDRSKPLDQQVEEVLHQKEFSCSVQFKMGDTAGKDWYNIYTHYIDFSEFYSNITPTYEGLSYAIEVFDDSFNMWKPLVFNAFNNKKSYRLDSLLYAGCTISAYIPKGTGSTSPKPSGN